MLGVAQSLEKEPGEFVAALIRSRAAVPGRSRALLDHARLPEHRMAPTLLGAWRLAGRPSSAAMRAELAEHEARAAALRGALEECRRACPEAYAVKGPVLAERYPAGLPRHARDVDVVVPPQAFFAVARHLVDGGWTVDNLVVLGSAGGDHELVATLLRAGPNPLWPLEVELRTCALVGDFLARAPVPASDAAWLPQDVLTLLALLEEFAERPPSSRDCLDAALLLEHLAGLPERLPVAATATRHYGLGTQWHRLLRAVRSSSLAPHVLPMAARMHVSAGRAARWARATGRRWLRPRSLAAYAVQRWSARGGGPRRLEPLVQRAETRMTTQAVLASGLAGYCARLTPGQRAPLDPAHPAPLDPAHPSGARLRPAGRYQHLDTPLGAWLVVPTEFIDPAELERADVTLWCDEEER